MLIIIAKGLKAIQLANGLDSWVNGSKGFKNYMKQLVKMVFDFLRREWFLFVAVAAIGLIILLFEIL